MKKGEDFEKLVKEHSSLQGITVIKVPEILRVVRGKPFRIKTEFDFCAGIDGISAFFDAKVITGTTPFNFKSRLIGPKNIHQWKELSSAHVNFNIAGLLFWFKSHQKYCWASVPTLDNLIKNFNSLTPFSEGVVCQTDTIPLNLRYLLHQDRQVIAKSIGGVS